MATLVIWALSVGYEIVFNNKKELLPVVYGCLFFQIANWVVRFWVSREPLFVNTVVSLLHSSFASVSGIPSPSLFLILVDFDLGNLLLFWCL